MVRVPRVWALLLLWGGLIAPLAAAVEVSIDRNPVQVNESFQLVFSADHSPSSDPDFSVLQQNFQVLGNNRSNSISIINGDYRRSVKWTLQLMASQPGDYTIPAIDFGNEQSEPLQLVVKSSASAIDPQTEQTLEVVVDRDEVYVQGQIVLTMRLLSATDISAYEFGKIPAQELDLVIEPLGDPRQYQTRIGGRAYLVLEQQFALFPQRSGPLQIPAILGEVRMRSRSAFDPFNANGAVRRLRSQPLSIEVKPIPGEFAGDHWLPADRVELREKWPDDLNGLVAGEPITRSILLVVDGLTAAQLPEIELQPIDGIKQYPDQPVLRDQRGNQGIQAQRGQKVALIPASAGVYRVPEIAVKWWNRATERIETAVLPARELVVNAAAGSAIADDNPLPGALPTAADTGLLTAAAPGRFWVWLSLFLAMGWLSSIAFWWLRLRRRVTAESPGDQLPGLRAAGRSLQQACANNDAQAARAALLPFGQALLAPADIPNLNALNQRLGSEFAEAVEALNQSLYAGQRADWQGDSLWAICHSLQQTKNTGQSVTGEGLQPLNP